MIKKLILVLFLLLGCAPKVDPIELNKTVELEFYYVQGCSECKAFKEDVIPYLEKTFNDNLSFDSHLEVHATYTKEQILAALGKNTIEKQYPLREGVLYIEDKKSDVFLITLNVLPLS